jgi:hypothetical protein
MKSAPSNDTSTRTSIHSLSLTSALLLLGSTPQEIAYGVDIVLTATTFQQLPQIR